MKLFAGNQSVTVTRGLPALNWHLPEDHAHNMRMQFLEPFMQHIATGRKRAINLSLSESVIEKARLYSTNLSSTVDTLLTQFVEQQQRARTSHQERAEACAGDWNAIHEKVGSFADEHSTL
jgi:antitoxin CcdA